jgi:hypothetical protein
MLKIIRFLRILRLLRVFKLKKLVYKVEEYVVTDTLTLIMDSIKILTVIFFMTHLMAWTFYYIGEYEADENPLTWISDNKIQDMSNYEKYVTSVYFSFTTITTVGYGDINPVTNLEKLYTMMGMLIACGFFAYIVGSIGSIVNKSNIMVAEFRLRITHINQFLISKNIPSDLKSTIMSYLEYMWDYKRMYKLEEGEVLDMLNETLRDQLIVYLNGQILQASPVFKYFSMLFLSEITFHLGHHTFAIDDNVFEEGNIGDILYFINKGSVILVHKKSKTFIKELEVETWFGEVSFFSDLPRAATASAKTFTETMFIERRKFDQIAQIYTTNKTMFDEIYQLIRERGDLSPIGVIWYVCNQLGHMAMECPEYWRIEGNVKRHLRRLRSITSKFVNGEDSENKDKNDKFHRKMTSKAYKKRQVQDEEIREMIKYNLEHGGSEDIFEIIRKNQELEEDNDEIGLHDHVFDSSSEDKKKNNNDEPSLSAIIEDDEDSEIPSMAKRDTFKKKKGMNQKIFSSKKLIIKQVTENDKRKNFPKIDVTKMSTLHHESVTMHIKKSDHSKNSKNIK